MRKKIVKFIKNNFPLRIIKTCLAFFISISVAPFFGIDSFFSGVGALKTMQQSITLSIKEILNQTFANIIGIFFAIIFGYFLGINAASVSIAVFLLFLVIKHTNIQETYLTAAFVLIAVLYLSNDEAELIARSLTRVTANIFGMIVALLVNIIIFRPKKYDDLVSILVKLNEVIHLYMTHDLDDYSAMKIAEYKDELNDEKSIIKKELKVSFLSKKRKQGLRDRLKEIEIVLAQIELVFELPSLSVELSDEIIPILIQLDFIRHYEQDKSKIPAIKDQIRKIYLDNTNKYDFFSNSSFLAALNNYLNLLLEY